MDFIDGFDAEESDEYLTETIEHLSEQTTIRSRLPAWINMHEAVIGGNDTLNLTIPVDWPRRWSIKRLKQEAEVREDKIIATSARLMEPWIGPLDVRSRITARREARASLESIRVIFDTNSSETNAEGPLIIVEFGFESPYHTYL